MIGFFRQTSFKGMPQLAWPVDSIKISLISEYSVPHYGVFFRSQALPIVWPIGGYDIKLAFTELSV